MSNTFRTNGYNLSSNYELYSITFQIVPRFSYVSCYITTDPKRIDRCNCELCAMNTTKKTYTNCVKNFHCSIMRGSRSVAIIQQGMWIDKFM